MKANLPIVWSRQAISDLSSLENYYTKASEQIAAKVLTEIFEMVEKIQLFPAKHQVDPRLKKGYRYLVVRHCKIFFTIEEECIRIMKIFDTRQDPGKLKIE